LGKLAAANLRQVAEPAGKVCLKLDEIAGGNSPAPP
jgi:hypothetical protein